MLCSGLAFLNIQGRCRRNGSVVANFLGAITGASLAQESFGNQCYYQDGPAYEYIYPEAPRYIYSYPTYMYAPNYSYMHVRNNVYPSYHFRRQFR